MPFGMLQPVVSQKLNNVSEVLNASIIRAVSKLHAKNWVKKYEQADLLHVAYLLP
jgi:hypothetical protein